MTSFPLPERQMLVREFRTKFWPLKCRVRESNILEICLNYSQHNESLKCERLKAQKIRRRPESCHGFHPEVSQKTFPFLLFPSDLPWESHHGQRTITSKFTHEKTIHFRQIKEEYTGRLMVLYFQPLNAFLFRLC